jgi:hypothetical protein
VKLSAAKLRVDDHRAADAYGDCQAKGDEEWPREPHKSSSYPPGCTRERPALRQAVIVARKVWRVHRWRHLHLHLRRWWRLDDWRPLLIRVRVRVRVSIRIVAETINAMPEHVTWPTIDHGRLRGRHVISDR